jgi:hypothetical protein
MWKAPKTKNLLSSTTTSDTSRSAVSIASSIFVDPTSALPGAPIFASQTSFGQQFTSNTAQGPNPTALLPTQTYTGQPILVGTCAIPMYTAILLPDGSYLAAPIIGCDNNHPQCCPSLSAGAVTPALPTSFGSLTNADIITALAASPLTICPGDYTSTSSACCPV